jgi:hypothetical protein
VIRGYLYVIGGTCAYVAANIYAPHDLRGWIAFYAGTFGNACILWRAYLDQSHVRYDVSKPITTLEPSTMEHTEASTTTTTIDTTKITP